MRNGSDRKGPSAERVDLSPLDPLADPVAFERTLDRISGLAGPLLQPRRPAQDVLSLIAVWRRPILAASGLFACLALLVLLFPAPREAETDGLAEAAGFPRGIAEWVDSDETPSAATLIAWEAAP